MVVVDKSKVIEIIKRWYNGYMMMGRKMAARALKDTLEEIEELKAEEWPVIVTEEEARVSRNLEAYFKGGSTGREVCRCARCGAQLYEGSSVRSKDKYCHECGRRLIWKK